MGNVIFALIVMSVLAVWMGGWYGAGIVLLFLFGAWGYSKSGTKKPGKIRKFVEQLGIDDDEPNP